MKIGIIGLIDQDCIESMSDEFMKEILIPDYISFAKK